MPDTHVADYVRLLLAIGLNVLGLAYLGLFAHATADDDKPPSK